MPAQGTVEQGLVRVITEICIVIVVNAVDERVRIVGRHTDQGKYIAGLRVQRDRGTGMITECSFRCCLQTRVQRQVEILPGYRWCPLEYAHHAALCRRLHLADTDGAVQQFFIGLFDTGLANMGGTAVVGSVDAFQGLCVNPSDIAECMYPQLPHGIATRQACLDFNAREEVPVYREARHFLVT